MAPGNALEVRGIGKCYKISGSETATTLREGLTQSVRRVARRVAARAPRVESKDFWALRDIDLEVAQGESVALIGANGSGKSTFLKILSRIVAPTEGEARIRGRVGAMLEVGTGFHPELSGHDNIFLNGAIIGMSASDIRRRYDEIVAFSGVEDFLGLPIKRYSSGMVMRLAFAVAAHLEPDVLIIDEVLAVGDAAFQQKCMARMTEVRSSGCTLFFVSHNLAAVQQMCSRAILLRNGRLAADGPTSETVTAYLAGVGLHSRPSTWIRLQSTHIARGPKVTAIRYGSPLIGGSPPCSLGPLHVDVEIQAPEPSQAILAIDIKDEFGNLLINADLFKKQSQTLTLASGPNLFRLSIDSLPLEAGRYFLDVWLADPLGRTTDLQKSVSDLELRTALGEYAPSDRSPQRDGLVPCSFAVTPLPSAANGPSTAA